MPTTRYLPFPDLGTHQPTQVDVIIQQRHLQTVVEVEQRRRTARAERVWVALTADARVRSVDAPIAVDLLDPHGAVWPCGHLSESDTPGWRRLLRLSFKAGVTWIWPAAIVEPNPGSWRVMYYH